MRRKPSGSVLPVHTLLTWLRHKGRTLPLGPVKICKVFQIFGSETAKNLVLVWAEVLQRLIMSVDIIISPRKMNSNCVVSRHAVYSE